MRVGLMNVPSGPQTLDGLVGQVRAAEAAGFATYWLPNIFGFDAISSLAIAGRESQGIELGTAVVPTYPRHPAAMAQQALTASAASGRRFTLGIGLSHQPVIEGMFGMSYDRPARHMREYLEVLTPLLRGEPAKFEGELYRVNANIQVPDAAPVPLLVAALGPAMLRVAGRLADGTITWMTGVRTLGDHIVPTLSAAASDAGRAAPRIVAGLPVTLTKDVDAGRARVDEVFGMYPSMASYKAMLDREGVPMPSGIALVGDESSLRQQVAALADAGVTDLLASVTPVAPQDAQPTVEFLASL